MSSVSVRRLAELEAKVLGEIQAVRAAQAANHELLLEVRGLLCGRPSRDQHDAKLRHLLPASTKGLPFKASVLLRHTTEDGELRRALEAATVRSVDEIGAWLRDQQGTRAGVTIERLPRREWRATYTSSRDVPK